MLAAGFNMLGCSLDRDRDRIIGQVIEHVRERAGK
jgi:hypothetical protein